MGLFLERKQREHDRLSDAVKNRKKNPRKGREV